jgi:putative salt-induced outer membrane protein
METITRLATGFATRFATLFALAVLPHAANAQVTTKPDGVFRSLFGAAASVSGGNTNATTVTLTGEAVRQTDRSKWGMAGRLFYARGEEGTTAASGALSTQYDQDLINNDYFGVGKVDYMRDRPSNIDSRVSTYGGVGRHLVRNDRNIWDVFAGIGYAEDRFVAPVDVGGEMRTRYGRTEGVVSQSSNHKLTPSATVRQKLEWYPNLRARGEHRAVADLGLSVAMTESLQLTTGLLYRYTTDPGAQVKNYDVLFLTGVSVRFD